MSEYLEVVTTFETVGDAEVMAGAIIDQKLGACCSIVKIESVYRWKGDVQFEHEFQLTIKTKASLYEKLEKYIIENHPYEIPQIIAVPVINGSKEYIKWLEDQVA